MARRAEPGRHSGTAFRSAHVADHRDADAASRDPDLQSSEARSPWLLPLQRASADLYYVWRILRDRARIPAEDRLPIAGTVIPILGGDGDEAALCWPTILWPACASNDPSHQPHAVEQSLCSCVATDARAGDGGGPASGAAS